MLNEGHYANGNPSFLTCTVYSVDVDIDAGASQHTHDGFAVLFFDLVLEYHLIGEAHPPFTWIIPCEDTRSSAHGVIT